MQRKRVAILASYLYPGQYRGIMRYGQQAGWICQRMDRDTLPRLNSWSPDGLLFQVDEFDTPLMDRVGGSMLPKTGLRALPGVTTPLALIDFAAIGHQAATHFVARNYRRLCYLGPWSNETANAGSTHVAGMRQVADIHGIPLECVFPDRADTWKSLGLAYRRRTSNSWDRFWELGSALLDRLTGDREPVAVFSAFAEPAMQFMEMVDERRHAGSCQIGIAAQTEDALNGLVTRVPMTCLVPDYERQGYEAAMLLDRMLDGRPVGSTHRTWIPEFGLVERESTIRIVTADPRLDEMLVHIRRNAAGKNYASQQLATEFGCSLRAIQGRFRKAIGRGVAEVIREHRARHAAELIRKTNLPLHRIAEQCGFTGYHQLERSIRASCGMGPSALRKHQAGSGNRITITRHTEYQMP